MKTHVMAIVLAACTLTACASAGHATTTRAAAASSSTIAVVGNLQLFGGSDSFDSLVTCVGKGGYSDIAEGAQVVISDDSGKTLAITNLTEGETMSSGEVCKFKFSATIPAGLKFYGVTVTHRGTVKMSEAEVPSASLTLGN